MNLELIGANIILLFFDYFLNHVTLCQKICDKIGKVVDFDGYFSLLMEKLMDGEGSKHIS
jgi:hypothetical protein